MGEIRIFTEEHVEEAASLYLRAVRGQNRPPGQNLPQYFRELHFSNPWASPDLPGWVYLEHGKVIGLIGCVPRTMEFRGRPIVLASKSIYMVDHDYRKGPAAVQLLGRFLKGPQDLSWTDGASGSVGEFWKAMGGHIASAYAYNWIRVLRPFGTARIGLERIGKPGRLLKPLSGAFTFPADFLLSKLPVGALRAPVSRYRAKLATPDEMLECIRQLGWRETLRPSYEPVSFRWLMEQSAKTRFGNLRLVTVSDDTGALCGWFIYYAASGGASWVLQIGTRRRDDFPETLAALFRDAWEQGSACIKGASIPQHLTDLTKQHCFFRHPENRVVIHSKNPDIANALRTGEAAITRLDGTSWMRFARESWD